MSGFGGVISLDLLAIFHFAELLNFFVRAPEKIFFEKVR